MRGIVFACEELECDLKGCNQSTLLSWQCCWNCSFFRSTTGVNLAIIGNIGSCVRSSSYVSFRSPRLKESTVRGDGGYL